jgi:hypothetical protein
MSRPCRRSRLAWLTDWGFRTSGMSALAQCVIMDASTPVKSMYSLSPQGTACMVQSSAHSSIWINDEVAEVVSAAVWEEGLPSGRHNFVYSIHRRCHFQLACCIFLDPAQCLIDFVSILWNKTLKHHHVHFCERAGIVLHVRKREMQLNISHGQVGVSLSLHGAGNHRREITNLPSADDGYTFLQSSAIQEGRAGFTRSATLKRWSDRGSLKDQRACLQPLLQ